MNPLGRRVLIKPRAKEEATKGGIILASATQKQQARGVVSAIGKDVTLVAIGDDVYFSPFHYDEIDEENFIIDEQDIWAIVK